MIHWCRPQYTIETEFGTLHAVSEEDAMAATECFHSEPPIKYTMTRESHVPDWGYIVGMVLFISVVIVGLAYLFRG